MLKYLLLVLCVTGICNSQRMSNIPDPSGGSSVDVVNICPGAYSMEEYLPFLMSKSIAVVVNHTSIVANTHLVDTLLTVGVDVKAILSPEHGFKGEADAGEKIKDDKYLNRIPIYSLYGSTKKPTTDMLKGIDVILFDIQDVGVRFYTYISTLHYVMESAAEHGIPLIILDRPNPNGHYVDGPVLDLKYQSFVGMHPVPIVYGMTIGEYGMMINGERWLKNEAYCNLKVVPCKSYRHDMFYDLPIAPSPNLPNARSILLYPSLCLFEGTTISVGRGTADQFQVIGHPQWKNAQHHFTPVSSYGAKSPLHEGLLCGGRSFTDMDPMEIKQQALFQLDYLVAAHDNLSSQGIQFFNDNNFFEKLAGNDQLRKQIADGMPISEIRSSWQADLQSFLKVRQKYLLYD